MKFIIGILILIIIASSLFAIVITSMDEVHSKLEFVEYGRIQEKITPDIRGDAYSGNKGTASNVYLVNKQLYQSFKRFLAHDSVAIFHYRHIEDTTKTWYEMQKM